MWQPFKTAWKATPLFLSQADDAHFPRPLCSTNLCRRRHDRYACSTGKSSNDFPRGPDWRSPFLFFFQDKVELEYHITEKHRPYGIVLP
jgi:hypothetical protein